ncbi:Crp/Fnr family transcriptional regulator [Rahnella victoriana]|uniref:helix-turn-helix domain-containing protein n=1 Tax=Rahnella victoriana TaxID=1510570 RepID=UPI000BB1CA39|nr:helix-turn-helix domain-containing protein [Rahnella victoriana]PBI80456.1 Crp/Fnr family transcriptional regulator [Rahnella victoriana]
MMITPLPKRPESSMQQVIAALQPAGIEMDIVPRKRVLWEYKQIPQIFIFLQGEMSVLRASDGLVIATAYEPSIFGIAESIQPLHCHILRAETESSMLRLDASVAHEIITANNLWQDVSVILTYYTNYLFYRDALLVQQRTYSVIRGHLLELIQLPLEARLKVTILDYIQERTLLSRSSILNVIFAFKNGAYIEIKRGGYLLEVINLPSKF